MVYRETPRIAAKDGRLDGVIDDADSRPRLRRFDFVRSERQLDLPRVLLASCLVVAGVALIGYLGTQALRTMIRWLHQQPQYQVKFLDIRLQNEPPAWFRGGARGLPAAGSGECQGSGSSSGPGARDRTDRPGLQTLPLG